MPTPDELRAEIAKARSAFRSALEGASANWERQPAMEKRYGLRVRQPSTRSALSRGSPPRYVSPVATPDSTQSSLPTQRPPTHSRPLTKSPRIATAA